MGRERAREREREGGGERKGERERWRGGVVGILARVVSRFIYGRRKVLSTISQKTYRG